VSDPTRPARLAILNGFLVEATEDGSIPLSARYYAAELRDSEVSLELCRRWNAHAELLAFVEMVANRKSGEGPDMVSAQVAEARALLVTFGEVTP